MRLSALHLTRYGNFRDQRICFDPRPRRINLLYAPNGSGKSVLRQAFGDLLFGIHSRTPMGFRHGYAGMQLVAEVAGTDGEPLRIARRKGTNALIDAAGNPDRGGALARLLGGNDRALLERLFALDTGRLRQGGEELLASGGALADALLAAGGLRGAKALRLRLEEAADALAPSRRSAKPPFYQALDQFLAADKAAKAALLRPDDWTRLERDLAAAEAERATQNRQAAAAARREAQLRRLRAIRAPLAEYDAASAWLASHPEAPLLAASLANRLTSVAQADALARSQLDQKRADRAALAEKHALIRVDPELLAAGDEIDRFAERSGAIDKSEADRPHVLAEHQAALKQIAVILQSLDSPLPAAEARAAIPSHAAVAAAKALIAEHAAITAALQSGPAAIRAAGEDIAAEEAALAALPADAGIAALRRLVEDIRAAGDPAQRAEELAANAAEAGAALAAERALLPGWRGDLDALAALALPAAASIERLFDQRAAAESARAAWQRQCEETVRQRDQARERLAAAAGPAGVADETAIAGARAKRDRGWQLIFRRAFTADRPTAAEEQAFAGAVPLPLAYAAAVEAADRLADRRVTEADAIDRVSAARRALAEAEQRAAAAATGLAPAEQAAAEADAAIAAACESLPFGPAPEIGEIRAFLAGRARVIEARQRWNREDQAAQRLAARHAAWSASLAEALDTPVTTLPLLLAEAEDRLAAAARAAEQRIAITARLAALGRQRDTAARALAAATARHETWRAAWEKALRALGRPAEETPAVTDSVLERARQLEDAIQKAAGLEERLAGMHADALAFNAAVRALATRLTPELAPAADATTSEMIARARLLRESLRAERDKHARQDLARQQLEGAGTQIAALTQTAAQREAALRAVLDACGAATVEEAERRLDLAQARRAQEEARDRAAVVLRQLAEGIPIETLREELARISADEIAGEIARAKAAAEAANQAAQEAASLTTARRVAMERQAGDQAYEEARTRQQAAVATLDRVLVEALLNRLAAGLLGRAMAALEARESGGGSPVLARIGGYFATLTGGAFPRITAEDDAAGLALGIIPADAPEERKRVDQLSEGTRDQLFLALRLAAIEDHIASAPPLPFVGDDILQTSDDARAGCALRALLDLSERVQVILLTHHPHIIDLARALPGEVVHLCEIEAA